MERLTRAAWLCRLIILTAAGPAHTQETQFKTERITVEQGLSMNSIRSMMQDPDGYLWIGTYDGLNKYDGYTFTIYRNRPGDPTSLSGYKVYSICRDTEGMLWLATNNGLNRFDPVSEKVKRYYYDAGDAYSISYDDIEVVYCDRQGVLWIGTSGGGLNRYDRERDRFISFRNELPDTFSLGEARINAILEDRKGHLWIGTELKGLYRYDPVKNTISGFEGRTFASINGIVEDRSGVIWFGASTQGVYRYDGGDRFTRYLPDPNKPDIHLDNHVSALYMDGEGVFWVGTQSGMLQTFDPEKQKFNPVVNSGSQIRSIFEDQSGIIWLGGDDGGLMKIRYLNRPFRHWLDVTDESDTNHVTAIYEDSRGRLWFGTLADGVIRYDPAGERFAYYRHRPDQADSLIQNNIRAIVEDPEGYIWIGTDGGGLDRLDPASGSFTNYGSQEQNPHSLIKFNIRSLLVDSRGTLWVGAKGGLHRYVREKDHFRRYIWKPQSSVHPIDKVRDIYEDRSGNLWLGTDGGLLDFDPERETHTRYRNDVNDPQSLSFDKVRVIHEDHAGMLWVGTWNGLNRFDRQTKKFNYYTEQDGLPSNVIHGLLEDDGGFLWLSTPQGLSKFDPRTGVFRNYGSKDGLLNLSFEKSAFCKTGSGELFFGGRKGADSFFAEQVQDNPHIPPIAITGFKIFDRPVRFEAPIMDLDAIEVHYRENFITFEFAALDFVDPEQNRYAYRMEGFDPDWIYPDSSIRFANYTNLDPGIYTFRVKGSNNDGVWNETGASVALRIVPPFWMTRWFRVLSITFLLLLGFAIHQIVTRSIRRRNRELSRINRRLNREIAARAKTEQDLRMKNSEMEQFTYTVSHDLKSPLITIRGFLGMLKKKIAQGKPEETDRYIERIYAASGTMGELLDDLLKLSRIGRLDNPREDIPFAQPVEQAVKLVEGAVTERGARVLVGSDLPVVRVDGPRLVMMLQNLVENAVKFMGDQTEPVIEIGCRRDGSEPVFYVSDNGIGIDPAYHHKIFDLFDRLDQTIEGTGIGLTMVRKVVETHGGRIWVESEGPSHGSTFCFTLPIKREHVRDGGKDVA
ncbi:MAG: two-component regulator propeller domain-containing protein [Acidobacteriota bacterium]|nr:two-component regulator propeller domain-containing protein [Acidobacteriota bacterium]